jgi:hypothetical protein
MSNTPERAALVALINEIAYRCARDHGGLSPLNCSRMCSACLSEIGALLAVSSGGAGEAQPVYPNAEKGLKPFAQLIAAETSVPRVMDMLRGIQAAAYAAARDEHLMKMAEFVAQQPSPEPRAEPPVGEVEAQDLEIGREILTRCGSAGWGTADFIKAGSIARAAIRRVSTSPADTECECAGFMSSYCPKCDAASTASAQQRPTREWQPIETAPEAEHIIVWVPNAGWRRAIKTTHPSDGAVWWDGEEVVSRPTHWMRQPKEPTP